MHMFQMSPKVFQSPFGSKYEFGGFRKTNNSNDFKCNHYLLIKAFFSKWYKEKGYLLPVY